MPYRHHVLSWRILYVFVDNSLASSANSHFFFAYFLISIFILFRFFFGLTERPPPRIAKFLFFAYFMSFCGFLLLSYFVSFVD